MILDKLNEAKKYEAMHPLFREAFDFLKNAEDKPCGRYELSGGMYVVISDVRTHEPGTGRFEAHRQFIDIQYLFSGHSACVWAHTPELKTVVPYDGEKDVLFLEGAGAPVPVHGGEFYVLYPEDAHEPHQSFGEADGYRVAVVKVPV